MATAEITEVVVNGVATPSGPTAPGIGVLGKGGVQISGSSHGAGVVGLAGGADIPAISIENIGVVGSGTATGGAFAGGVGIFAIGSQNRAAVFTSASKQPQINLVPLENTVVPPATGAVGDLLLIGPTLNNRDVAVQLWLCVTGGNQSNPAT